MSSKWNSKPITVYGISKLTGEHWCQYHHQKYNFDVRSIRYPGLISFKSPPGGGTTDYVMDMFRAATAETEMRCAINPEKALPMLYISDAVEATIQLMHAESSKIMSEIRTISEACLFHQSNWPWHCKNDTHILDPSIKETSGMILRRVGPIACRTRGEL